MTIPFAHPLNNYDINTLFNAPLNLHVTFDSQGGTGVPDQTVEYGYPVIEPPDPTRTGYRFDGWWTKDADDEWEAPWDFNTVITADRGTYLILYARWAALPIQVTGTVRGLVDNEGVVIFYSAHGGSVTGTTTTDVSGEYRFDVLYDSDVVITPSFQAGYSVYPEFIEIVATEESVLGNDFEYTQNFDVLFESNGGSSIPSQTVAYGGQVTRPPDPIKEGYAFGGWYMDDGSFEVPWDFGSEVVTGPLTLYAKWMPDEPTPGEPNAPSEGLGTPGTGDGILFVLWAPIFFLSLFVSAGLVVLGNRKRRIE